MGTVYCLVGQGRRPSVVVLLDTFATSIVTGVVVALFAGVEGGSGAGAAATVRQHSANAIPSK